MAERKTVESRRDFFRSLGRYMTLGLIGAGGGVLGSRGLDKAGQSCINKSVCCSCGAFDGCRLPAALSARQNGERSRKEG